jgi:uncharacterized protein YdaU (DUF1376 family)
MNYYPFHIGDYISHTSHLTDEEDLAYRRMIDLYYHSEQPFTDVEYVARRVKSTPEIISVLLSDFFLKTEDGWRNKRADEEIEKYHAKAESARNANKAKLEKKSALKSELKSEPNQDATNNQEPITNNHIKDIAPVGVSESIFKDYLEVRKAKKAKWTQTALKGLQREADKAKMSLQDVMQLCCERNWVGFKAEWANSQNPVSKKADDKSLMFSNEGIEAKARELGVSDYGVANHFQLKDKILQVMAKKAIQ